MTDDFNETARRLRNAVEPVAAGVHFALKANAAHQALRFDGSPITQDGVARSGMKTCFFSRSACMGQVPGEVVASAFGCFNPKAVVPAVAAGWQITNRERILAARERVAIAMLERILGDQPKRLDRGHRAAPSDLRWAAIPPVAARLGALVQSMARHNVKPGQEFTGYA